jgi:dihydrofolate synthase / folylpolyglutamate synthase
MLNNLEEWLVYIEQIYTTNIDLGLERVQFLAKKLNIDSFDCPVITVAGTNGKGSSVTFLEHILLAANYKVATYTSPHLINFTERIKINGRDVGEAELCKAFEVIDAAVKNSLSENCSWHLTYFEFTTLAAFYIFKNTSLDALILEIGLGGRFDAVNIIDPDIALIATIALDHTNLLGNDRETIGREKAGIMRSNKPVVCGDPNLPNSIINYAQEIGAKLYRLNQDFSYQLHANSWDWESAQTKLKNLPIPQLPIQNAANVLMAIELLNSLLAIEPEAIRTGLANAKLMGRYHILASNPEIIVDVAHNPESGGLLAKRLRDNPGIGRTFAVVGMLKDKDITNTLKPFTGLVSTWYLTDLNNPRGATAELLKQQLGAFEKNLCYTHASVIEAYNHALSNSATDDRIIVFGSFYTVTEIYKSRVN